MTTHTTRWRWHPTEGNVRAKNPKPGATNNFGTNPRDVEQKTAPNPYPERPTSTTGVRQHNLALVPDRIEPPPLRTTPADPSFAASLQPFPTKHHRPLLPIASITASIMGQAGIGALTATATVDPAHAIAISVGWLTCSIAVIFAQCASIARNRTG